MQITRQTDYAIRCILFLVKRAITNEKVVMVEEIAESMNIPKSFLAKILQRLKKSGIVSSIRGVKGGFVLNRDVSKINLLEVIQAIDGPVSVNRCALDKRYCGMSCFCTVHPVWLGLRDIIQDYLKSITFDKLINEKDKKVPLEPKKQILKRRSL